MPVNLASPGILVKEVDLTTGRVDPTTDKIGAIVGVFEKGPVGTPVLIQNENELLEVFGKPFSTGNQFETWFVASSYLAYGGSLRVIRANDTQLLNAKHGSGSAIEIKSPEHYDSLGYDESVITGLGVIARDPGSRGNGLRVAMIDSFGDQVLECADTDHGYAPGDLVIQEQTGVKIINSDGTVSTVGGTIEGVVTEAVGKNVTVKVVRFDPDGADAVYAVEYNNTYRFRSGFALGGGGSSATCSPSDWFDARTLTLGSGAGGVSRTVKWSSLVPRPGTTSFGETKSALNDELHVIVIDDTGEITGNAGTILEKHIGLSKATDGEFSSGSVSYWRQYLRQNSAYIYGGQGSALRSGSLMTSGFTDLTGNSNTNDAWDQKSSGKTFNVLGVYNETLGAGADYNGDTTGSHADRFNVSLADVVGQYDVFSDGDTYDVDFLLMGSSSYSSVEESQALAQKLIAVAESRKDAIAFISPARTNVLTNDEPVAGNTAKQSILDFYSPLTSSSYAVFDTGYKYMYDRFNSKFRYVPLNGDIAGICARNDINNFPWFSPAGTVRGGILNAVKLAYNPTQAHRDELYSNRVNPVIFSPGAGIVLFGDKTGLGKSSAFDRINVRRLFIYLQDAISAAAKDALFEFNDEITRTNFVNTVEPFLRDVQAKRGITDFVVICDETNNTASVIDSNEFIADIYVKPARSINFIGLTFIATKTGVSFEEVIGNF